MAYLTSHFTLLICRSRLVTLSKW